MSFFHSLSPLSVSAVSHSILSHPTFYVPCYRIACRVSCLILKLFRVEFWWFLCNVFGLQMLGTFFPIITT